MKQSNMCALNVRAEVLCGVPKARHLLSGMLVGCHTTLMRAALPAGRHSAVTRLMARREAIAAAVRRLSPVTR